MKKKSTSNRINIKLVSCLLVGIICFLETAAQNDQFAKIGGQTYTLRKDQLIEPAPQKLIQKKLPSGILSASPFQFIEPIHTKEALYHELDSMRKVYEPFMKNLVPIKMQTRKRVPITTMNWRIESKEDQLNFANTLLGKGNWEKVNMPHYGPPIGNAVTYYQKEIIVTDELLQMGSLFVCFKGVDYKTEVYFNGVLCGTHEGFFAPFEFDVIKYAKKGNNILLVKVINEPTTTGSNDENGNHTIGNKLYAAGGLGYDEPMEGWHICPPAMGIYQDCYLEARSNLFIGDIFVRPLPSQSKAEVWVEINNTSTIPKNVVLQLSVFGQNFSDTIILDKSFLATTTHIPGIGDMVKPTDWQTKNLPMQYGANYLRIPISFKAFRWWQQQQPWLYSLQLTLKDANNQLCDIQAKSFGMRSFEMDTVHIPKGRMFLNGKQIRLRGANSMGFEQNDVKNKNWAQLRDDILLAKLGNLNFLRFTQRPVQSEVYDYCDQLGMLNQTDLPLFGGLRISQFAQAVKQAEEMERLVRGHPSSIVVTYINERFPNADGSPQRSFSNADEYYKLFKALDQAVLLSNPDRVIKPGDGDYDPPSPGLPDAHCYNTWYNGHALDLGKFYKGYWQLIKPNWLYGCGEYGAEGLDPLNTMLKYYPKNWLPQNEQENMVWNANKISKSQTNTFHYMWYPTQTGLENWIEESQNFQQWAVQLVTESFRRDKRNVSSAVHLFIDAWPAGWMKAIIDVDRQPKKAFFAYRNALAPLMGSLRTDRFSFYEGEPVNIEAWVCNDLNEAPTNYTIRYEVNIDGKTIVRQKSLASIPLNSSAFQGFINFKVPPILKRTTANIVLGIFNSNGLCIHKTNQIVHLFPPAERLQKKVFIFGNASSKSAIILVEMHAVPVTSINKAQALIIDNINDYIKNKKVIDLFVEQGGKVLFTEIKAGDFTIADNNVSIKKTIMGNYYFANPTLNLLNTGNFQAKDFFMWYDKTKGYIQPLLYNVFKANKWMPLITTGLCNFAGEDPAGYLAAASYTYGEGSFVLCEISLANRIKENPNASNLLLNMLNN